MEYPKKIMNMKELMKLGYTERYLYRIFCTRGQTCAFRLNPLNPRSRILFDTDELEKMKEREIRAQQKGMHLRDSHA
jgi:hypothetical protein